MKTAASPFLSLGRRPDLDQETAFTIARMIDNVGHDLRDDWDWDWLCGKRKDYRRLVDPALLEAAWPLLFRKEWFSLQTVSDDDKKISTISPLEGFVNLRTLVLQDNLVQDLRPLSGMARLKYLNCHGNRVRDLHPIANLRELEKFSIAENPVSSFRVLEELPNLQDLSISVEQLAAFTQCKRLDRLQCLRISGEGSVENFLQFPEMPGLKVLDTYRAKDLAGIERFGALESLELFGAAISSVECLGTLKALTHLTVSNSKPLNVSPLAGAYALRYLSIRAPKVQGLETLAGLPVLHEFQTDDKSKYDTKELNALREGLTSWDGEFKTDSKGLKPSLDLQVVDQETFDHYDSKMPFGVRAGECNDGMLDSERRWLVLRLSDFLTLTFEKNKDFVLPFTTGFRRSERLILYSVAAYESFREIVLAVQRVLCEARNDWIIYFQSLLCESPEEQDVPDGMDDFIVWIYPDKIVATEEIAPVVRKLIDWKACE